MATFAEQRRYIIERLNYNRIRQVMVALNWTWVGSAEPPLQTEMIATADQLLDVVHRHMETSNSFRYSASTGGFEATGDRAEDGSVVYGVTFRVDYVDGKYAR